MLDRLITCPGTPRSTLPRTDGGWARCLALMLDEVDYGVLLLDAQGSARLLNRSARQALEGHHPLHLVGGHVQARSRDDMAALAAAQAAANERNQRELLTLGESGNRCSVAVVPLGADALDGAPATMLLLGKRQLGENLSVRKFARSHRLTPAETRVLGALCAGVPPAQVAEQQGVRISTVRTQIGGLREKTGAHSIRALVRMVAVLPPMAPAWRDEAGGGRNSVAPGALNVAGM
jgi:DNA-binding CsgD family transcriptional regulator